MPDPATLTVDDRRFPTVGTTLKQKSGVSLDHESEPTVGVEITVEDSPGVWS